MRKVYKIQFEITSLLLRRLSSTPCLFVRLPSTKGRKNIVISFVTFLPFSPSFLPGLFLLPGRLYRRFRIKIQGGEDKNGLNLYDCALSPSYFDVRYGKVYNLSHGTPDVLARG